MKFLAVLLSLQGEVPLRGFISPCGFNEDSVATNASHMSGPNAPTTRLELHLLYLRTSYNIRFFIFSSLLRRFSLIF